MTESDGRVWHVVCERTGVLTPIDKAWFVYDRGEQKWLIIADSAEGLFSDHTIHAHDLIGTGEEQIDMLLYIGEKVWFNRDDFAATIARAYLQLYK